MSSSLAQGSNGWLLTEAVRRALRKRARRLGWLSGMSLALAAGLSVSPAQAELPVICVTGATCGNSSSIINNALQGVSGIGIAGNTMTVNQNAANAVLHWRSFNISGDSSVNFVQPSRDSVALNRIYQNGASQIMGNLSANGRIYLINQNGIVFGAGAVVNVAGLIASSLDISSLALNADGETNLTLPGRTQQAAFRPFDDADGNALASGDITVGQGATITTADGGQVFMFAPNVHNYGSIATPGGQTVLAAGDSVYLASSADRNLRGIWVEVGTGGTVVNGVDGNATEADPSKLVGQIVAERGNVTLAGAAVNQLGRVTATTSVNEAGSIRLVARDGGRIPAASTGVDPVILSGDRGGTLTLGSNSRTEVQLAASDDTTVDSSRQPVSQVAAIGRQIVMERAASVVAPHGDVTFAACADCGSITDNSLATVKEFVNQASSIPDGSRIYVADGALIDVSGADINRSMQSNVLKVELRGDELADSELLRDSGLRGETVYIDIRRRGRHADGSEWVGSPIGDLSGWLSGIEKKVDERSLTGGTVNFLSRGDVLLNRGSTVDVSGGSITHADGYINTSGVLGADGRLYDIADAAPDREYVGVTGSGTLTTFDRRWGVMRTYAAGGTQGHFEPGYVEGKDAGTVQVVANRTVLEADIKAEVEVGRYQRRLSGDFNAATATALYRPYDELALSGTLILGQSHADGDQPDYAVGDVVISGSTTPQLAAQFDPLTDSLSDLGSTVRLSSDLFGAGRVGNLTLRANGTVSVAEGTTVVLPPGGEMDVTAGAIEVAGSITTHGGDIALTARPTLTESPLGAGLVVKSGATLDTSGIWVNDSINANGGQVGTDTLAIAGGSVRLHAQRNSLALQSGSVIDVSGGAQVTGSGKFVSGDAGIIDLGNTQPFDAVAAVTHMTLDGELRAYGFENGGSLSLDTTGVCIADAASACQHSNASTMWLNPEFFTTGGFGSFTIGSNRGGIEVAAGTTVTLRQRNRIAPTSGDVSRLATATSLDAIAGIGLLEDIDRHAVDLALNARPSLPGSAGYTSAAFADAANLVIGTGARIEADVGGNINLSSSSRLLVDGTVAAAAGNIGLALSSELVIADSTAPEADLYFEDQGIWLGDDAQLLARGAALTVNDDQGRVFGEVFDGGNISIDANRGHVVTSSGSLIDVSGTSAALSIKSDTQGHYRTDRVASAAGTVDIEASEAILVGGDLYGVSGDPGNLAGGTLRISLDSSLRNDPGQIRAVVDTRSMLPGGERTIEITQRALDIGFGDSTLPGYQGKAVVAAEQVAEGGFDALELNATTTWTSEGASSNTVHAGRIEFDGDVSLALARSIQMNAAVIASDGGAARVSAPIVTLGNAATDLNSAQYQAPVRAGTGTLQVDAGQIDVVGSSVLQGLAATTLQSSGDLRLIGVQVEQQGAAQPSLQGSLRTTGDVTLSAAQVYPTTLTQFTVAAGVDTDQGTLQITQNGTAGDALSAGGALTLSAAKVVQSGTVRAPFGSITIDSPRIELTAGSVTSTSGAGLDVLYGETEGGLNWVYVLNGNRKVIYGEGGRPIVDQRIELNGDELALDAGAVLDVSGGGNLLATEFISGTTGKRDVLGEDISSGAFAIVPAASLHSAAYDQRIVTEAQFEGGKSIHLSGTADLPAGEYIMLPARYALLPGAYLVRPVSDYQDIGAGESYRSSDGSIVVSGYYTYTGTDLRDSARTSGFAILEGEAVQNKARYTLTNANDFFAPEELAAGNHGFVQRLPRDAGTVAITATESLTLQGSLRAEVEDGGRGAALDIASSAIEVVAGADSAVGGTGALILDAADLSALGAESILLGGVRSENVNGVSIATRSSTVTIAGGAALSAPEVMLAATDTVTVEHDASITAGGAEVRSEDISLNGSGAFVRVATAAAADVRRTNAGNSGRVAIASGATLSAASGSISLETSGDADLSGALAATGGEVSFTGNLISLGNVDPAVSGLVLDAAQLSQLDAATLSLNSRNSIDWYGAVDLDFANLSLSARALRGYDDGTVSIDAAGDVTFRGGDSINDPADSIAAGQLNLTANNVIFDGGAVELSGFDNVALLANRELRAGISGNLDEHAADSATLDVVGGNLQLGAQRVTTASGVDFSVTAAGRATLSGSGATQSLEAVNDLGGSFTLEAGAIELATRIELPSGLVTLNAIDAAQGGITVTGNAAIAVGGLSTEFADSIAHSSGGHVKLDTASGDLLLAEGSSIDVSASGGTNAGSIELTAAAGNLRVAGTLAGSADNGGATGSFSADAQNLGDFAALAQRVNTGGFAGDLNFHQRGVGDLTVASGATVQGTSVSMTADRGSVVVAGSILSHGDDGGRINLAASNGMTVSGTLDARATNAEERNGRIGLNVSSGGLNVTDGAVIATVAAGAAAGTSGDGSVAVRLPQQALLTVIDADSSNDNVRLGGDWSRTRDVSVEGFAVHVDADGILDDNDVIALPGNVIYDQAAAFAARTDAISTALSNAGMPALEVLTGIEIQSGNPDGSLTLDTLADTDWDLSAWRFAAGSGALTRAGVLTLRATGDLTFNDSLSDGFSTLTPESYFKLELGFGDSWSYNLIAGADTASADVMATQSATHAGSVIINGGTDSFSSANYTFVRTGTGSIDVAAAADIVLSNDAAMIYTAGEASDGMIYPIDRRGQGNQLGGLYYPTNGGDITLSAGRDISRRDALFAPQTDQLVSEWLWRIGNVDSPNTRSTAWSVNFDQFHQGVAALAGGDVTASAGGNITDVSVSTTTIGRQQNNIANDRTAAANSLDVIGGGNVSVAAGGDILGGSYYSGRGKLELQAQGEVGESKLNGLAPILLLSDTQAKVTARTGVRIDGVATPTLLPQGVSQGQRESTNSAFSTYSTDSSLAVESTAGDASVVANDSKINEVYGFTGEQADLAFTLLPGTVDALALRGSATVNGTLMPDENGALSVRAYQDVNFDVIVSDVDPNDLPDADRPMTDAFAIADATGGYLALTNWEDARDRLLDVFNAATPVRLQAAQQGRLSASRLVAARGDVTGRGYFGSAVDIHAGDDVVDVDLALQNLVPSDVSTITAGGDIAYTLSRAAGGLAPNDNGIEIDGPGQLLLTAGGNIDLGTSEGVVSQGDEINPVLADTGASITALAGLDGEAPDYAAFGQEYVHHRDAHSEALMDYIEASTGNRPSDAAAARATFAGLGDRQQRVFLQRVLLTEVRASAEEAASADRKDDYSRGFDALETLFPGSTAADNNPYRGDISLFFSRINTLDGGDISLLTPGGGVNVGLAAETLRRFGIDKTPGDLGVVTRRGGQVGIVTDGDVQVNESRIFAINDSDIVVWSSNGDIDAGRGAKTAISAPTSTVTYDLDGHAFVRYDAALSGSGIQARTTTSDFERGAVVLAAPRGIVNASDAGIVAGDLTIAATAVLGADNISVSGLAVGVPVDTGGLGASLAGVAASASSASKAASTAVDDGDSRDQPAASIAEAALSWLDVFVIGLGEEGCKQDDLECLKRQSPAL